MFGLKEKHQITHPSRIRNGWCHFGITHVLHTSCELKIGYRLDMNSIQIYHAWAQMCSHCLWDVCGTTRQQSQFITRSHNQCPKKWLIKFAESERALVRMLGFGLFPPPWMMGCSIPSMSVNAVRNGMAAIWGSAWRTTRIRTLPITSCTVSKTLCGGVRHVWPDNCSSQGNCLLQNVSNNLSQMWLDVVSDLLLVALRFVDPIGFPSDAAPCWSSACKLLHGSVLCCRVFMDLYDFVVA